MNAHHAPITADLNGNTSMSTMDAATYAQMQTLLGRNVQIQWRGHLIWPYFRVLKLAPLNDEFKLLPITEDGLPICKEGRWCHWMDVLAIEPMAMELA